MAGLAVQTTQQGNFPYVTRALPGRSLAGARPRPGHNAPTRHFSLSGTAWPRPLRHPVNDLHAADPLLSCNDRPALSPVSAVVHGRRGPAVRHFPVAAALTAGPPLASAPATAAAAATLIRRHPYPPARRPACHGRCRAHSPPATCHGRRRAHSPARHLPRLLPRPCRRLPPAGRSSPAPISHHRFRAVQERS